MMSSPVRPEAAALPVRRVALLSLAVFLVGVPFAAYVGLAPAIQAEWGLVERSSAALYGAYLLGAALAAGIILPRMRSGSPRAILLSALLAGGAHLSLAVAPGPGTGVLTRLVAGGAYIVVYYGAVQWIAAVTPGSHRARAIGVMVAAGYAGSSASYLLVAAVLGSGLSWRLGYALLALPGLGAVAVAWLAVRGPVPRQAPDGQRVESARATHLPGRRRRSLGLAIVGYAVHSAELFVARFWIPYALLTVVAPARPSPSAAGAFVLSGVLFASGVLSPFLGGWSADRVGTGRTTRLVLLSGSGLATLLLVTDHPYLFVGFVLVYCIVLPADSAVFTAAVTMFARPDRLGHAQAVQAVVGFTAAGVAPALVGLMIDATRGGEAWKVALGANAVLALVGAVLMHAIDSGGLKPGETP